jgi:hypothetical protein
MRTIPIFLRALLPRLVAGVACLAALTAVAQWQWLDKDGRKVYSDRAPPADVLDKSILKRPGGLAKAAAKPEPALNPDGTVAVVAQTTQTAPAPQAASSLPKLSGVDKERRAEDEKIAKAKIENCALGKQAKTSLDSGIRIARTNAKGEREVLDDAARAAEAKRVQNIIDSSCK